MARINPRRLTDPAILKKVSTARLVRFLDPHKPYFSSRGFDLVNLRSETPDYESLIDILLKLGEDAPDELVVDIYFVNDMADDACASDLEDRCREEGRELDLEENATAADVAIEVWMSHREVIEKAHATRLLDRRRNFRSYGGELNSAADPDLTVDTLTEIESDLRAWFAGLNRGRWCRVTTSNSRGQTWFLISHGERYTREPSIKDGRPSSALYRPETVDVVFHDRRTNELWINADAREADTYRAVFGIKLFGRPDYFSSDDKYTLEPIRRDASQCLNCVDVDGIKSVRLLEVEVISHGTPWLGRIYRSDDLFGALERLHVTLPQAATLTRAKFKFVFEDSKRPRTVRIILPNAGVYARDQDAPIVEQWLRARGFIISNRDRTGETLPVLDSPGEFARSERVVS